MKVYINLQKARVELQKMNLKKSGRNTHTEFNYFELKDFLPTINELMMKYNLCSNIEFTSELATLTIVSTEDGSTVKFTSPMASANLKACHDIQNLGAVQTYLRRYLYMNAFEIVELDTLDAVQGKETKQAAPRKLSDAQVKRLIAIASSKGQNVANLKKVALRDYNVNNLEDLSKADYDKLCNRLESI